MYDLSHTKALGCPDALRKGDIYTHTFHGFEKPIISLSPPPPAIDVAVINARKRGVVFDVGHGQGSFSWTVAEICSAQGFWPDTISTDLHTGNVHGPAYDLPTVMTKMLHLGMPLYDVIKAATATPASVIGRERESGSLAVGRLADVAVLKLVDCDVSLEDCQSQMRRVQKRLLPVAVWRKGRKVDVSQPASFPSINEAHLRERAKDWQRLVVRDAEKPVYAQ